MRKILAFALLISSLTTFSQESAQDRAEETVKKYLVKSFTKEKYKSFGFGELYKISPPEIVEIEELKKKVDVLRKKNLLTDSTLKYYDSTIRLKVNAVKKKRLYSTYDIKHYFVIKEGTKNFLYYYDFSLYPDGKIKDVDQLMKLQFVNVEYDWFYNYYRRSTLILNDAKENANCYTYLDGLIKNNTEDRESTMATVIGTHGVISRYSYMDTAMVPRVVAQNWLIRNNTEEVTIKKYSDVSAIFDQGEKIGYKLFIEYEINNQRFAHYFEFDTLFILRGNLPVEKPYDSYFIKKVKK